MAILNISTNSDDCYGGTYGSVFYPNLTNISMGDIAGEGSNAKAWIPFVVPITKGTEITSATFKVVASANNSTTTVKVRIGCEASDDASTPTNWTQLNAKTMTTVYLTNNNVGTYVAGTEYTYDITSSVQEVIDRAGWVNGNTLAVLIFDNDSTTDVKRAFASSENTSYTEAILVLDYPVAETITSKIEPMWFM